jgi:hypothetical protein
MLSPRDTGLSSLFYAFILCTTLINAVVVHPSCNSISTEITSAIQEATSMAQHAHDVLQASLDDDTLPVGQKKLSPVLEMVTTELFSSFFGSISSQDATGNNQGQNQEARATSVIGMA